MQTLSDEVIEDSYSQIKSRWERDLKPFGVRLPRLRVKGKFTKDALVLVYLFQGYPNTSIVSKTELTQFVRQFYPDVNDVQQARHLGAQKGWYIAAGGRDNRVAELKTGQYKLITLEDPYPGFRQSPSSDTSNWKAVKALYGNRCATCGSEEGKPHLHYPSVRTKLEQAHRDPTKPLGPGNVIPQCSQCNRTYRNHWVYDERGRIVALANPSVIKKSDVEIRRKVYRILYREFRGRNPLEW